MKERSLQRVSWASPVMPLDLPQGQGVTRAGWADMQDQGVQERGPALRGTHPRRQPCELLVGALERVGSLEVQRR